MALGRRLSLCCALLTLAWGSFAEIKERCVRGCCSSTQGNTRVIKCSLIDRKGEVPIPKDKTSSAYQIMHFSNGLRVTVHHNALDRLETALLTDMQHLSFLGSTETQPRRAVDATTATSGNMTIDRVRNLRLNSNSLDGWQSNDSIVWIKNIENCVIDGSAFAPSTTIKLLLLENITSLVLKEDAFQANVGEMRLRNVTIVDCPRGAFGGRVGRLLMHNVTVKTMKSGCVSPQQAWKMRSLVLRRSHLGQVSTSGITGSIADLVVTECDISTVDSGGIHVSVSHFTLNATSIGDLHPDAMEVEADVAISLQRFGVSRLHENAFRGLRVDGTHNRGIKIMDLSVRRADNGSMMFSEGADVHVRELSFEIYKECAGMSGDAYTHSVYVQSAWQPAHETSDVPSRLHTTIFQPLFACDFEAEMRSLYERKEREAMASPELISTTDNVHPPGTDGEEIQLN